MALLTEQRMEIPKAPTMDYSSEIKTGLKTEQRTEIAKALKMDYLKEIKTGLLKGQLKELLKASLMALPKALRKAQSREIAKAPTTAARMDFSTEIGSGL